MNHPSQGNDCGFDLMFRLRDPRFHYTATRAPLRPRHSYPVTAVSCFSFLNVKLHLYASLRVLLSYNWLTEVNVKRIR